MSCSQWDYSLLSSFVLMWCVNYQVARNIIPNNILIKTIFWFCMFYSILQVITKKHVVFIPNRYSFKYSRIIRSLYNMNHTIRPSQGNNNSPQQNIHRLDDTNIWCCQVNYNNIITLYIIVVSIHVQQLRRNNNDPCTPVE